MRCFFFIKSPFPDPKEWFFLPGGFFHKGGSLYNGRKSLPPGHNNVFLKTPCGGAPTQKNGSPGGPKSPWGGPPYLWGGFTLGPLFPQNFGPTPVNTHTQIFSGFPRSFPAGFFDTQFAGSSEKKAPVSIAEGFKLLGPKHQVPILLKWKRFISMAVKPGSAEPDPFPPFKLKLVRNF